MGSVAFISIILPVASMVVRSYIAARIVTDVSRGLATLYDSTKRHTDMPSTTLAKYAATQLIGRISS